MALGFGEVGIGFDFEDLFGVALYDRVGRGGRGMEWGWSGRRGRTDKNQERRDRGLRS
jgi:hypothetical protein